MKLFDFDGDKVNVASEALLLEPVKKIKKECKNNAELLKVLSYVFFYCDVKSDFASMIDEEEKHNTIVEAVGLPPKWKPSQAVTDFMQFYEDRLSIAEGVLKDTQAVANGLRRTLRIILNDTNTKKDSENVIKDAVNLAALLEKIPRIINSLNEAEIVLKNYDTSISDASGTATKSLCEDF